MNQVPISTLPDEMLAMHMIFEAGTLFNEEPQCHFRTLVSRVTSLASYCSINPPPVERNLV